MIIIMVVSSSFGCATKPTERECEIIKIDIIDINTFEFDILYKNNDGYIKPLNTLDKSDMKYICYKISENNSYTLIEKNDLFGCCYILYIPNDIIA